ncbi:MAG: amidohydrolase family protein [Gammaproteobacteria bacterium]
MSALAVGCNGNLSPRYDIVITEGRIIDPETAFDAVRNLAVDQGKIVKITSEPLQGRATIDAKGLAVAPGFIDLHSHAQFPESRKFQAHDGVTTALELEVGVYPVAAWYDAQGGSALINFGATVSHLAARANVMDGLSIGHLTSPKGFEIARRSDRWVKDAANASETERLVRALDRGLSEGALGVGLPLQYTAGASREEIFRVFKLAAQKDATLFNHLRFSGNTQVDGGIAGLQEILGNAAATGASAHIAHITSSGIRQTSDMVEMIVGAKAQGLEISMEAYPYTAASTALGSAFFDPGWQQRYGIDYGDLVYVKTNERLTEENFLKYRAQGGLVIAHMIPGDITLFAVRHPSVMIASDALNFINGNGHPRAAGTFARVLGRYVREKKALPLMQALRKMTIMPAQRLEKYVPQMRTKGRVQVGADADLTLFNPNTVIDTATYENPMRYSAGIEYVIVNGKLIIEEGELIDGVFPGRPIRNSQTSP